MCLWEHIIIGVIFIGASLWSMILAEDYPTNYMPFAERNKLKEEARDMFYHAYHAYMENAYPADELMPLSCKGRFRGVTPTRGDMDDILGNFSLTLVDSLDTLVILGDFSEFESAVRTVIKDVSFDTDVIVSVFETNIRMLGGLLSAHIFASELQSGGDFFSWYRGELLSLAHDLGRRLLPAFNTTTGIPYSRVNLKYGVRGLQNSRETCTACAGTMILEMAALSRLTGENIFEQKAHKAMDRLWKIRHRSSELMGTVLNVHSGDWIRKESGVGAGIDSYYEYCLKAYIFLGDETYLARFYRHYNAVMKYISRGPIMLDVHMHRPDMQSRHFMDALLAFWPGLQVLLGDVKPAVETHEMLYQVMQRHTFIPEAFTADFQVHWGQHPLRPEFLESTYFLHRATGDDHYLWVARAVLKSLQKYTRVSCGYAAVNDVRTRIHEDRMDSYVLAETFKYLYMIFSDDADLPINLQNYILTTEAHFLPLSLADNNNNSSDFAGFEEDEVFQYSRSCSNSANFLPETVRRPLKNMIPECPSSSSLGKLSAKHFKPCDPQHMHTLADMGISILTLSDGRVQLLHTLSMAKSSRDAKDGLIFMREMAELSEQSSVNGDIPVRLSAVCLGSLQTDKILVAAPADFGPELKGNNRVVSNVVYAKPSKACDTLTDVDSYVGNIVIVKRGDCTFVDKVRKLQAAGAVGVIIIDNIDGSMHTSSFWFIMSGDGNNDVTIPSVFLFSDDANTLKSELSKNPDILVTLGNMESILSERKVMEDKLLHQLRWIMSSKELESNLLKKSSIHSSGESLNLQDKLNEKLRIKTNEYNEKKIIHIKTDDIIDVKDENEKKHKSDKDTINKKDSTKLNKNTEELISNIQEINKILETSENADEDAFVKLPMMFHDHLIDFLKSISSSGSKQKEPLADNKVVFPYEYLDKLKTNEHSEHIIQGLLSNLNFHALGYQNKVNNVNNNVEDKLTLLKDYLNNIKSEIQKNDNVDENV